MLLACDPSINFNGIAIFNNDNKLTEHFLIQGKGNTEQEKIKSILLKLMFIIANREIDTIVLEKPPTITYNRSKYYTKTLNAGAIQKLNMVVGAITGYISVTFPDIKLITVDVLQWKGRQKKEVTRMNAQMLYKVTTKNMNITDAIMLGHWYISYKNMYGGIK